MFFSITQNSLVKKEKRRKKYFSCLSLYFFCYLILDNWRGKKIKFCYKILSCLKYVFLYLFVYLLLSIFHFWSVKSTMIWAVKLFNQNNLLSLPLNSLEKFPFTLRKVLQKFLKDSLQDSTKTQIKFAYTVGIDIYRQVWVAGTQGIQIPERSVHKRIFG